MVFSNSYYSISEFLYKEGYTLKKVFCDTYTINCNQLIEIVAMVLMADSQSSNMPDVIDVCIDIDDVKKINQEELKGKLVIHSHHDPYPSNNYILTENGLELWNVCGKKIDIQQGKFHPKLMLACFERENNWFYRLQVSSSNFTETMGAETAVIVEGISGGNNKCNGSVLNEFYKKIDSELAKDAALQGLDSTEFLMNYPSCEKRVSVDNIRFAYNYPNDKSENIIKAVLSKEFKNKTIYAYSPFIKFDNNGETYFDSVSKNVSYFTNLTQSIRDNQAILSEKNVFYSKKPCPFLHAKMYRYDISQEEKKYRIWMGSANASKSAWENNVEFMIGMDVKIEKDTGDGCRSNERMLRWQSMEVCCQKDDPQINYYELNVDSKLKDEDVFSSSEILFEAQKILNQINISAQENDAEKMDILLQFKLDSDKTGEIIFYKKSMDEMVRIPFEKQLTNKMQQTIDKNE